MSLSVSQATEVDLKNQVARLIDQRARLEANMHEANSETEKLRVELLQNQPPKFALDGDQPLMQSLQQRIAANKAYFTFLYDFATC